jgi:hypothetical protein
MRKPFLVVSSMAAAMLLACLAVVLTAEPGVGKTRTVTLVGAGDIAGCGFGADHGTAKLLGKTQGTVITIGDNVYPDGTSAQFRRCYGRTWGKYKNRTKPTLGNHDYGTPGAKPYFDYFGKAAGKPGKGYYSYDRGSWHIVALNSQCEQVGGCGAASRQGRWLRKDLAKHQVKCTLAYFHHPLFAAGRGYDSPEKVKRFWHILNKRGADVILSAHAHRYERYAPQTPGGKRSDRGIREFIVGTGGAPGGTQYGPDDPHLQSKNLRTPGVLKLRLGSGTYHWRFIPVAGRNFTDSGQDQCH